MSLAIQLRAFVEQSRWCLARTVPDTVLWKNS